MWKFDCMIIQFTRILDILPRDIYNHESICLRELGSDCVKIKQLQIKQNNLKGT